MSVTFHRFSVKPTSLRGVFASCSRTASRPYLANREMGFFRLPQARRFRSYPPSNSEIPLNKLLVWSIIGCNVAVFGAWQYGLGSLIFKEVPLPDRLPILRNFRGNMMLSWRSIHEGRWWTVLTSAFSHINPPHLLLNMYSFYQLSALLVYTPGIGPLRIASLVLGSATAASFAWLMEKSSSPAKNEAALGASGIVMGVTGAVACLAPTMRVLLFGIVPIPLWAFGVSTALIDTYFLGQNTGIGHSAHLGGGAFGVAYYFLFLRRIAFR